MEELKNQVGDWNIEGSLLDGTAPAEFRPEIEEDGVNTTDATQGASGVFGDGRGGEHGGQV
jgi:hypothetical protein